MIDLFKNILPKDTNYFIGRQHLYFTLVQVGIGGNGANITPIIAQMMATQGIKGRYILVDPDIVEAKNLKNQWFVESDIGRYKAQVLAERYSSAFNVDIGYHTTGYIETEQQLKELFLSVSDNTPAKYNNVNHIPLLISCVDNNYSRQVFHRFFEECETLFYCDVGNESVKLPIDRLKPREMWNEQEISDYESSGYTGQVVMGARIRGKEYLAPVGKVFKNILEDQDEIAPSDMSCSALLASDPQRLITNRYSALVVSTYLNELFSDGKLTNHYSLYHAKKGYVRSFTA